MAFQPVDKEISYKLMIDLLKQYSIEEIACMVKKSSQTVQAWKQQKRNMQWPDYTLLNEVLKKG